MNKNKPTLIRNKKSIKPEKIIEEISESFEIKDRNKSFSAYSLNDALDILKIDEPLITKDYEISYRVRDDETIEFAFKVMLSQLEIRSDIANSNEATREAICSTIVSGATAYMKKKYNLPLNICNQIRLTVDLSRGTLDFYIYKLAGRNTHKVLLVFETKKDTFNSEAGQLIMELVTVYEQNKSKAYGFMTNLIHWQMFTYEQLVDEEGKIKNIVEKYGIITFVNIDKPDKETFYLLTDIFLDVLEKTKYY